MHAKTAQLSQTYSGQWTLVQLKSMFGIPLTWNYLVCSDRSCSCWGSTSDGDLVRTHWAVVVFGKAITSLMELVPANNITSLSNPNAIPPACATYQLVKHIQMNVQQFIFRLTSWPRQCLDISRPHTESTFFRINLACKWFTINARQVYISYHEEEHPCPKPPVGSQTLLQPVDKNSITLVLERCKYVVKKRNNVL